MVKLLILGASGTGCTTLGDNLSKRLKIPHFDGDDYYWIKTDPPYTTKRELPQKQELLKKDVSNHESWVFSGSPESWAPFVLPMLTATVFLYSPWPIRKARITKREIDRFGDRVLPGGDMYEKHMEFLNWAKGYETNNTSSRTLVRHNNLIKGLKCLVFKVEGDVSADITLSKVIDFIESVS